METLTRAAPKSNHLPGDHPGSSSNRPAPQRHTRKRRVSIHLPRVRPCIGSRMNGKIIADDCVFAMNNKTRRVFFSCIYAFSTRRAATATDLSGAFPGRGAEADEEHSQRLRRKAGAQAHVRRHAPGFGAMADAQGHRLRTPTGGRPQKGTGPEVRGGENDTRKPSADMRPEKLSSIYGA